MFDPPPNAAPCLCCLHPNASRMKISKLNRPYMACGQCGSKTFLNSREALAGQALLAPQVMALLDAWRNAGGQIEAAISGVEARIKVAAA